MASLGYLPSLRLARQRFSFQNPSRPRSTAPLMRPQAIVLQESTKILPYHVSRTASQSLPVYHTIKRGGNLRQTLIRKIQGNVTQLKHDIQHALGLVEKDIVVGSLTTHIIIKGTMRGAVKKYLEQLGF